MDEVIVYAGFGLLFLGVVFLTRWLDQRRRAKLTAWAKERGWSYTPEEATASDEVTRFKTGQVGHNRYVKNVLHRRVDGRDVTILDYRYRTGSGQGANTHYLTVCIVQGDAHAPTFFIRRQIPLFDKLGKMLGGQDVDFDDDAEFSSRFVLQGEPGEQGEQGVRAAFTPAVRDHFKTRAAEQLVAEGADGRVLAHRGVILRPVDLDALVEEAVAIHRLWR